MQVTFLDCQQTAGRRLLTSTIQFYDLPGATIRPIAETEKALWDALAQWMGMESVTIFAIDWPPPFTH